MDRWNSQGSYSDPPLLSFVLALLAASAALGQPPVTCIANAGVPPMIRDFGLTELAGDLVLTCTGGTAGRVQPLQLEYYTNARVTSRLIGPTTSEALLIVDDLQGPYAAMHQATVAPAAPETGLPIFPGMPIWSFQFVEPGQTGVRTLRFTNVRVSASGVVPSDPLLLPEIIATIYASPAGAITIQNPQQIVGFVQTGISAQTRNCTGIGQPDAITAGTMPYSLQFQEQFYGALKSRLDPRQASLPPGAYTNTATESGFVRDPPLLPETVGRASSGTRLMAKFQNLPAGARVYVTTGTSFGSTPSAMAALVTTDENGGGGGLPVAPTTALSCADLGTAAAAEIPVTNNTALAVWEVTAILPWGMRNWVFGFRVAVPGQSTPYMPGMAVGFAPNYYPSTGGQSSDVLHIPRFNVASLRTLNVGARFFPIDPCRLVDTRKTAMAPGFGVPSLRGGYSRTVRVVEGGCGMAWLSMMNSAIAYAVNLTAIPKGPLGYMTLSPTGQNRPVVSTLNSLDGRVVANAAIVPAGINGRIDVYASNDTDFIIDVNGYFATGPGDMGGLDFVPLTPCRIADSRKPLPLPFGLPFLAGGTQREYPFLTSGCNIPADAYSFVTNMTVVPYGFLGYLTVWPTGSLRPTVSTLNAFNGLTTANAAIVKGDPPSGTVSAYVSNPTELIIDISGVFAPRSGQGQFYPVEPCRAVDTRLSTKPAGLGPPALVGGIERTFPLRQAACGILGTPTAYSVNVTLVPLEPVGYVTVWPAGSSRPLVSTLNSPNGAIIANAAIVPAGADGSITLYSSNATHVIIDINGYFRP